MEGYANAVFRKSLRFMLGCVVVSIDVVFKDHLIARLPSVLELFAYEPTPVISTCVCYCPDPLETRRIVVHARGGGSDRAVPWRGIFAPLILHGVSDGRAALQPHRSDGLHLEGGLHVRSCDGEEQKELPVFLVLVLVVAFVPPTARGGRRGHRRWSRINCSFCNSLRLTTL